MDNNQLDDQGNSVRSMLKSELARAYEVSLVTFRRWIRDVPGLLPSHNQRLKVSEVEKIYAHLGRP